MDDNDDSPVYKAFAELPGPIKRANTETVKSAKKTLKKVQSKSLSKPLRKSLRKSLRKHRFRKKHQHYDAPFTQKEKTFPESRRLPIQSNNAAASLVIPDNVYSNERYPAIARIYAPDTVVNATTFSSYSTNASGIQNDIDFDPEFLRNTCLNDQGLIDYEVSVLEKAKELYKGHDEYNKYRLKLFLDYYCELRKIILAVDYDFISNYTVLYHYFCYFLFNSSLDGEDESIRDRSILVEEKDKIIKQLKEFFKEIEAESINKGISIAEVLREHNDNEDGDYDIPSGPYDELVTKLNNRFYKEGKGAKRYRKSNQLNYNRLGGRKTKRSKPTKSISRSKK
jgi:hypothetical protein